MGTSAVADNLTTADQVWILHSCYERLNDDRRIYTYEDILEALRGEIEEHYYNFVIKSKMSDSSSYCRSL